MLLSTQYKTIRGLQLAAASLSRYLIIDIAHFKQ